MGVKNKSMVTLCSLVDLIHKLVEVGLTDFSILQTIFQHLIVF